VLTLAPVGETFRIVVLLAVALLAAAGLIVFVDWRQIGPPNALLSFEPTLEDRAVTLVGVTDLADGTTLDWRVSEGEPGQLGGVYFRSGETVAANGGFTATIPIPGELTGVLQVEVRFYPGTWQPPVTVERFGQDGEHLRGSGVVEDSGDPVLVVKREILVP
jgi:hypothetical protein